MVELSPLALGIMAVVLMSPGAIFAYLLRGKVNIGCSQTTWFFVFLISIFLFCIVTVGDFNYAGYKWAYIIMGATDVVLGLLLLWRILGRAEKAEKGDDDEETGSLNGS